MLSPFCDYKAQTRCEIPEVSTSTFPTMNREQLLELKKALSLSMSIGELQFCQKQYRHSERRLPTVEELCFLDGIVRGHRKESSFLSVADIAFPSAEAERTYQDLMKKHHRIHRGTPKVPPLLNRLEETLNESLRRYGRGSELPLVPVFSKEKALLLAAAGNIPRDTLSVKEEFPSALLFDLQNPYDTRSELSAKVEDLLLLLYPQERYDMSEQQDYLFLHRLSAFAESDVYKRSVRAFRAVSQSGVATAIASMTSGAYVEINRLPSVFDGGALYDLSFAEHGTLVVAIPQEYVNVWMAEAQKYGLAASKIARAIKGNRFMMRQNGKSPVTLRMSFLKELGTLCGAMHISPIEAEENVAPLHTNVSANLLAHDIKTSYAPTLERDGRLYHALGGKASGFEDGAESALLMITRSVLNGIALSDLSLHLCFLVPPFHSSRSAPHSSAFLTFLGAYRTCAECAVPLSVTFLPSEGIADDTTASFSLYASAPTPTTKIPSNTPTTVGSAISLLHVERDANNGICYPTIRDMLRFLADLHSSGELLSYSIERNTTAEELLEGLRPSGTFEVSAALSESASSLLTLLLETKKPLALCPPIATVTELTKREEHPDEWDPKLLSRKRRETPSVLLVALQDCGDIYPLGSEFLRASCRVATASFLEFTERPDISETSDVVIFCGKPSENTAALLSSARDNPRVRYALEECIRRDGIVLFHRATLGSITLDVPDQDQIRTLTDFKGSGCYTHEGLDPALVIRIVSYYR